MAAKGRLSTVWLLAVYLVQTVAELFLAPIGLSVTTEARAGLDSPRQMMALWFLATATGNAVGAARGSRLSGTAPDAARLPWTPFGVPRRGRGLPVLASAPRIAD